MDIITQQVEWIKARNLGGDNQLVKMMRLIESLEAENLNFRELAKAYADGIDLLEAENAQLKALCERVRMEASLIQEAADDEEA